MPDTKYLEWLELDKRIIQPLYSNKLTTRSPNSGIKTKRQKLSSSTRSFLDCSVFSEESQTLKTYLGVLWSGEDTSATLKSIEDFILSPDNKWKIKQDDISMPVILTVGRFLLGDAENKGFIQLAFSCESGHVKCCAALNSLLRLLSRGVNMHYEKF